MKSILFMLATIALASPISAEPAVTIEKADIEEAAAAADDQHPPSEEQSGVAELRKAIEVLNRMKFSGYLQAQYVHDERSRNETTSPTATRNFDQFSIRRGRVKFTYQLGKTSRFVLQPDVTTSGVVLKDGYVEFREPWTSWKHTLTAGQFNWPFGFEIMYSSSSREMPERSRVIRTLFPGERDRGVMLSGLGLADRLTYRVAIVNGTGTVQSFDYNKRKDFVGRLGYTVGPVGVGLSTYRGSELVSLSGLAAGREFDKERDGVEFQWTTPVPGLGLRGEYIRGVQPPIQGASSISEAADVDGWYLYAIQNLGKRHQFAVRVDEYDPNVDVGGNATRTIGGSYIFHWDAHSKVMLAYEEPKEQRNDPDDNVWTVRYQYSF